MQTRELQPTSIWNHFEDLNAVPRPSKQEARVIQFMLDFGNDLGLDTERDAIGNVIIRKKASVGMEDRETVILQSHIDMVHQKNGNTKFDFSTEGIRSYIDGEWVTAEGTTLGADNGMGAAAAMAVLSSATIKHPAIEALFTIDEETGMTGAKELEGNRLSGKILLNLDTEDDDEFSVGCAGGIDTNTNYKYQQIATPTDRVAFEIVIKGLKGGHSGMDIHLGRGNANLWMNQLVAEVNTKLEVNISEIEGGSLRNAIPRESRGIVLCAEKDVESFEELIRASVLNIKKTFSEVEPDAVIELSRSDDSPEMMMNYEDQSRIVEAISSTPNAVWKMSDKIEGLVETSSSFAKVTIRGGEFITKSLQRSMIENGKAEVAAAIKANYINMGAAVVQNGDYPGWDPNPSSEILNVLKREYIGMFNEEPKVAACHAGLECGILSKHLPNCDMISFGPTIRNAHSPDEKVNIKSVQKFWNFFLRILEETPKSK